MCHPSGEDTEYETNTEAKDASRNSVDVRPHKPACAIEKGHSSVLAAVHELPTGVPGFVDDGAESTFPVELPATLTPRLRATLTASTPMVYLACFAPHLVRAELGGKGYRLVREPLVPWRRDPRSAIVRGRLEAILFPCSSHDGSLGSPLARGYLAGAASRCKRSHPIGPELASRQHGGPGQQTHGGDGTVLQEIVLDQPR